MKNFNVSLPILYYPSAFVKNWFPRVFKKYFEIHFGLKFSVIIFGLYVDDLYVSFPTINYFYDSCVLIMLSSSSLNIQTNQS